MQKILVIVGPTATGKSALGRYLAKQLNGEVISADSRQVYRDFDIGTGKEVEQLRSGNARKETGKWIIDGIPVHFYDVADGHIQYSAYDYAIRARKVIDEIVSRSKLPIVVGGTGLYVRTLFAGISRAGFDSNLALRRHLDQKSVEDLQKLLSQIDPNSLNEMNQSDGKNPRRLMRRIEIALTKVHPKTFKLDSALYQIASQTTNQTIGNRLKPLEADVYKLGLIVSPKTLADSIQQRIDQMFQLGLFAEVKGLLAQGLTFKDPAMQAIGYREFTAFVSGEQSLSQTKEQIILHTIQYAKRQMTWFKKDQSIRWIDIANQKWQKEAESAVRSWYNNQEYDDKN